MTFGPRKPYGNSQNRTKKLNTGVLFPTKNKKSESAPDFSGNIELDNALLQDILEQSKTTGVFKIRLVGWKNTSQEHGVYLKLGASKDEPRPQGQQQVRSTGNEFGTDERKPWD